MTDLGSVAPFSPAEAVYMLVSLVLGCLAGVASNTNNLAHHGSYEQGREMKSALLGGMVGLLLAILILWRTGIKQLGYASAIGGGLFCDEIVALVPGYLAGAAQWIAARFGIKTATPSPPMDDQPPPPPPYGPSQSGPERKAP